MSRRMRLTSRWRRPGAVVLCISIEGREQATMKPHQTGRSPKTGDVSSRRVSGSTTTRPGSGRIDSKAAFVARPANLSAMDAMSQRSRPRVSGIHHLKFAISNLDVSIAWYERVLGARRVPSLDHVRSDGSRFAAVCEMVEWSGLYLELRQTGGQAHKDRGWDPITLTVRGRQDLVRWIDWLDRWGTTHSPLLTGIRGWLLIFEVSNPGDLIKRSEQC